MNHHWLTVFVAQVVVGSLLVFFAPDDGASDLGLLLLGGALGQGLTAQSRARDD